MYVELYGARNMVRYTKFKGYRDKSNNKKYKERWKEMHVLRTQCLNTKSSF
jgi:hypothetical protein